MNIGARDTIAHSHTCAKCSATNPPHHTVLSPRLVTKKKGGVVFADSLVANGLKETVDGLNNVTFFVPPNDALMVGGGQRLIN